MFPMKTRFSFLLLLFFFVGLSGVFAQVTTEPAIAVASNSVKIIYDASKGATALKDCNCDVYIHIGAVTESASSNEWSIVPFSWATTDPKAKMTKVAGQTNIYTFEFVPNGFFTNPNGLTIFRLGMVVRNGDGTKEGKSSANGDFFMAVSERP